MLHILSGLTGAICMMDDLLVFGQTQQEHDLRLEAVLSKISKAGVTLNSDKCQFSADTVKFLGHVIDGTGIHPDPDKLHTIQQMEAPSNIAELRRFLGMVTYLGKFVSNLSHKVKPLRDLLSAKNEWMWSDSQQNAFSQIKQELSNAPVLALYNPTSDTVVSADASSYGVGAVLMQKQLDHQWKPVAYASRSLTPTEEKYAQIEKEALGITWACERFSGYLVGMQFRVETDHKPLVPLLGTKNLEELPAHIQRFKMRLMRFTFTIYHTPGKDLTIADTLSRAPTYSASVADECFCQDTEMFVNTITTNLPATAQYLFARHGIPQELVTDNGPQYSSREFSKFAENFGFIHTTSSPKFPQSNGEAE